MALIVEDGTGKSDAESYASVADANDYNNKYVGSTTWTNASTKDKEIALRQATEYMESAWGLSWKGSKANEDQALSWPRFSVDDNDGDPVDDDVVPPEVIQVCCSFAIRTNGGTDLYPGSSDGSIKKTSDKVGPLSTSVEYVDGVGVQTKFSKEEGLVSKYMTGEGSSAIVGVSRA